VRAPFVAQNVAQEVRATSNLEAAEGGLDSSLPDGRVLVVITWSYGSVPQRILFESRGQFLGVLGGPDQDTLEGHECIEFGGSGSDFAEEPAARVQSRSRRL
jgi:hypothetical protein